MQDDNRAPQTIAHVRRSKDKQDEASQREIISKWAAAQHRKIDRYDCDAASGGIPWQQRQLGVLLEQCEPGDTIVVSEISRIARSTVGVLSFLETATERQINVVAIDVGIVLDGSLMATVVATTFGMAAQIERHLLRARTKAALQARKANGLPIGRQPGALGRENKLSGRESEIQQLLDAKVSRAAIARILQVSRTTLHAFLSAREQAAATKKTNQQEG